MHTFCISYFIRDTQNRLVRVERGENSSSHQDHTPGLPWIVDLGFVPMANQEVLPNMFQQPNFNGIPNPLGMPPNPNGNFVPNQPLNHPEGIPNVVGGKDNMERGSVHAEVAPPQYRTLRDYMNPPRQASSSGLVFLPQYTMLNIRLRMMQILPQFHGVESEKPYSFIKEFEEACMLMMDNSVPKKIFFIKLFPFCLKDIAKTWFNSLRPFMASFIRGIFEEVFLGE